MNKDEMKNHNCDNTNCNHNDTKGLCCLFNPENCKYRQLQKENAKLKQINSEGLAQLNLENGKLIIENENLRKENAELKEQISIKDILIKELQEQRVYWKESSFDWRHKFFKLDKVKRLIKKDKQLTKAKNLLKWALHSDPEHDEDFEKKWKEAEQFLKDLEK